MRNRCEFSNSFKLLPSSFFRPFLVQRLRLTKGAAEEKRRCVFELIPQKENFSRFYHHLSVFHFTDCVFCFCCCCFFISPTLTEWQKTDASERVTSSELLLFGCSHFYKKRHHSVRERTKGSSLFYGPLQMPPNRHK